MTETVVSLVGSGDLPGRIEECLALAHWRKLEQEIRDGFPATATAYGGTPLLELILSAQEHAPGGNKPLPLSLLEALLEHGLPRGVIQDDRGMTAVSLAAEYGQWAWMRRLIEEDCLIQTDQWPALCAIGFGRDNRFGCWVEKFIEEDDVEDFEREHAASTEKVVPLHPDEPLRYSPFERAWLELSKETPDMRDAVLRLAAAGVDIDACPSNLLPIDALVPEGVHRGGSALIAALEKDDREYARALVDAGAELNQIYAVWTSESSAALHTPLALAIRSGWLDVVQSILQTGEGMVPVPYTENGQVGLMHPLRMLVSLTDEVDRADMIALVASFMSPSEIEQEGVHCMTQAAFSNRVDYMIALHALGISYDVRTVNGFRPIHQACATGAEDAIEFLLTQGASLADTSNTGITAASLLLDKPELAKKFQAASQSGNVRMFRKRS